MTDNLRATFYSTLGFVLVVSLLCESAGAASKRLPYLNL